MLFLKTLPRYQVFIFNKPASKVLRPYSQKTVKIGDKCYIPVPCPTKGTPTAGSSWPDGDGTGQIKITRPVRQEPGVVRLGFIPEEWFQFFYPKTGVTGPYVFMVTFGTYLMSKEIYVMEHEYYGGLSMLLLIYLATVYVGPGLAKLIDKEINIYEKMWQQNRIDEENFYKELIEDEKTLQKSSEGQVILIAAKRENVHLQLEEEYRKRLMVVYKDVKARLDYQVSVFLVHRRMMHRNLIAWVVDQVLKSYTEEKAAQTIDSCIDQLAAMATQEKKA